MEFYATRASVYNRGKPPVSFLTQLVEWGRTAADEIFAPNPNPADIYASVKPVLGPWEGLLQRRAAMLEVMRVHAGFESSWNWDEGVDITNQNSMKHPEGEETGIFQVSFDSTYIADNAMVPFAEENGVGTVEAFIPAMKANHQLALEYYARLVRVSIAWAGPLKRGEVNDYLSRPAMKEFQSLLG